MRYLALACALAFGLALPAAAEDADVEAVSAAVYNYFDGQTERSLKKLEAAFAEEVTRMTFERDGALTSVPIAEVLPRWGSGEPGTEARVGRIIDMTITDGRIATVMFDSNGVFFDALTLLKTGGTWQIVAKVFVRQNKE